MEGQLREGSNRLTGQDRASSRHPWTGQCCCGGLTQPQVNAYDPHLSCGRSQVGICVCGPGRGSRIACCAHSQPHGCLQAWMTTSGCSGRVAGALWQQPPKRFFWLCKSSQGQGHLPSCLLDRGLQAPCSSACAGHCRPSSSEHTGLVKPTGCIQRLTTAVLLRQGCGSARRAWGMRGPPPWGTSGDAGVPRGTACWPMASLEPCTSGSAQVKLPPKLGSKLG